MILYAVILDFLKSHACTIIIVFVPLHTNQKEKQFNSFSSRLKSHHCLSNTILYTIPVNMNSSYAFSFYSLVWIVDNDAMALVAVVVLEIDLTDTS